MNAVSAAVSKARVPEKMRKAAISGSSDLKQPLLFTLDPMDESSPRGLAPGALAFCPSLNFIPLSFHTDSSIKGRTPYLLCFREAASGVQAEIFACFRTMAGTRVMPQERVQGVQERLT